MKGFDHDQILSAAQQKGQVEKSSKKTILCPAPRRAQTGLISAPTSAFVGDRESIKLPA
jgi:hypothetical protein